VSPTRVNASRRERGPKTLVQTLAGLEIFSPGAPAKTKDSKTVTINTAPKAGQLWKLESIYFEFPSAVHAANAEKGEPIQFRIKVTTGGITIAKQTFDTTAPQGTGNSKYALVGNLEAFYRNAIYPGQDITITWELEFPGPEAPFATAETLVGQAILTYTQVDNA